jgi:hypothetical protein
VQRAYAVARRLAADETERSADAVPVACPFSLEEILPDPLGE